MDPAALADRLAELEARVTALEGAGEPVDASGSSGMVQYRGDVHLHGDVTWEIGYSAEAITALPQQNSVDVLAALGHPVRQALVRRLLHGPMNVADLQGAVGLSSAGQLYHHLKTLTAARVVEQQGRGDYRIAATRVVPILTMLLASADIAGDLGR